MSWTLDAADALALRVNGSGVGIVAVVDVAEATANRPCLLIPPPRIDWAARSITWRVIALAASTLGTRQAWEELADLVEAAAIVLDVETAEPITYNLPTGGDPIPAYALTITESY